MICLRNILRIIRDSPHLAQNSSNYVLIRVSGYWLLVLISVFLRSSVCVQHAERKKPSHPPKLSHPKHLQQKG